MIAFLKVAVFLEALQLAALAMFRQCLQPRHRGTVAMADMLAVLAIPLAGLFGHDKNVFYAFLFAMPLLWAGNPTGLAKRYVLVLVLFPDLTEVFAVGGLYLGPLSAFTFLNLGALVALLMTRRGRLKPVASIEVALWGLFLIDILIVGRGSPLNGTLRSVAITALLITAPYFVVSRAVGSAQAAGEVVSFMVLGGVCNSLVGMFEAVRHWAIYESFSGALGVKIGATSANLSMRAGLLRAGGATGNYEVLGLVTAMSLIAAIAIRRRFTTPGFYLVAATLAGGLFVSQARSAWIATLVGMMLQAIQERRGKKVATVAGAIALVAAPVWILAPAEGRLGQLLGKSGHAEATSQYRHQLLTRGLEEVTRHPVAGQTLDQLQVSMSDLRQGEGLIDYVNTHLLVALVGGLGLLALWVAVWLTPMVRGWTVHGRRAGPAEAVSASLPFALIGMTCLYLTFSSPVDRILSLVAISMGLMGVCIRLAERHATSGPRPIPSDLPGPGDPASPGDHPLLVGASR